MQKDLTHYTNIQCAAIKKTPLQKLQYLQNGAIFLYEIFSDYYRENLLYKFCAILCKFMEMM